MQLRSPKDPGSSAEKIAIAAERGDANAQRELGIQYLEAEGGNAIKKKVSIGCSVQQPRYSLYACACAL